MRPAYKYPLNRELEASYYPVALIMWFYFPKNRRDWEEKRLLNRKMF